MSRYINMVYNLANAQEHTFQSLTIYLEELEKHLDDLIPHNINYIKDKMKEEELMNDGKEGKKGPSRFDIPKKPKKPKKDQNFKKEVKK